MLLPTLHSLPIFLLFLLAHVNSSAATYASNPGDHNVILCGVNKGKTPLCTARVSNREVDIFRSLRMRLRLFVRDAGEMEASIGVTLGDEDHREDEALGWPEGAEALYLPEAVVRTGEEGESGGLDGSDSYGSLSGMLARRLENTDMEQRYRRIRGQNEASTVLGVRGGDGRRSRRRQTHRKDGRRSGEEWSQEIGSDVAWLIGLSDSF